MNLAPFSDPAAKADVDALIAGIFDEGPFPAPAAELDQATGGLLTRLREAGELTGKKNEVVTILAPTGVKARLLAIVGLGAKGDVDRGIASRAAGAAAKSVAGKPRAKVAYYLGLESNDDLQSAAIIGAMNGCVGQDLYRAEKNRHPFASILWNGASAEALNRGRILGEAVNLARKLVNEPPHAMYPATYVKAAEEVAAKTGLQIEVWDEKKLAAERCGSLLAVGQGSSRPPRLVILEHRGGKPNDPKLAIVGKGVTFDSGGLSLKPTDGMVTMKCDMAGSATVLAAMQAIAQLKLPVNVVGLAGLVENMPGGNSFKLGDVLTARSGKTIEVLNTDAEGRLVLADVLNVAIERGAARIVDLATLTGACVVALGTDVAGAMSNDQPWCDAVLAAAKTCGEPLWQLPMFPEYNPLIKSEVADIKNIGDGRWGGAITAAKFLEEFVEKKPWVHLDIAGPAFLDKPKPWLDGGGSGCFVRTLVELAARWPAV